MPDSGLLRLCCALALTVTVCSSVAQETLRVLAWPGYADTDVVRVFEERTGARVIVTLIDSDETLWHKINERDGENFDVFAVNAAELQRYISAALVVPIDLNAVPNRAAQQPRFRELSTRGNITRSGHTYAIPYAYAAMGLIYDRKQVPYPPDSIADLWDPRYQGKVLVYDSGTHNFSIAAQKLGAPSPFRLTSDDWPELVYSLISLRRNVLTFYKQPEESVAMFIRHDIALMFASYGTQQLQLLHAAGVQVGFVLPREGALAWLDCWTVTRGARNKALAFAWINYLLDPEPSSVLTRRHGLANTRSPLPEAMEGSDLVWLEPVESENRRNQLWSRIVSGYRASRVLSP